MDLSDKSSVPGLTRGLEVLRMLTTPMTLDEILRKTRIPKSSLQRILATLQDEQLLLKDPVTRAYRAGVQLIAHDALMEDQLEHEIEAAMVRLAKETSQTIEWYLPTRAGQVLARRQVPSDAIVHVRSWIGLVIPPNGYLSAPTCISRPWWSDYPSPDESFWLYGADQQKISLSHEEVLRRMREALQRGWAEDEHFDENGIKRLAGVVWGNGKPVGTLALARCNVPKHEAQSEQNQQILLRELWDITTLAKQIMPEIEKGGDAAQ
jgi:DNA-binding IclR family transcriptional regulator